MPGIMKTKDSDLARQLAEENHCAYGICVIDGMFYVGSAKNISKMPIVIWRNYDEVLKGRKNRSL